MRAISSVATVALAVFAFGTVTYTIYYFLVARTTPSHVFQVTEDVVRELRAFQASRGVTAAPVRYVPHNRKPRHVMQKAREVLMQAGELKRSLGLADNSPAEIPVERVTPANVRRVAEKILDAVRGLRPKFGAPGAPPPVPFVNGKVPTDVYANLALIGDMLRSLGVRPWQPKDVYRLVVTVIRDLEAILRAENRACQVGPQEIAPGISPRDVYARAHALLGSILVSDRLVRRSDHEKFVLPRPNPGPIEPGDVLDLLNIVIADVGALKLASQVDNPAVAAPEQPTKVPGDVYAALGHAGALVDCLS